MNTLSNAGSPAPAQVTGSLVKALLAATIAMSLTIPQGAAATDANDVAQNNNKKEEAKKSAASAPQNAKNLSEVTVTARKRVEREVDIPIGMSVIGGEQLEAAGITNVGDALLTAPGVAAFDAGGGFTYVQVRGASARQGSNETGYYLDDVPFDGVTVPWYPDTRSFDIENIQVLKGPQGTLFGEGSIGGTVVVTTRKPDLNAFQTTMQTNVSSTQGGTDGWGGKVMVNIPLVADKLALRVAGTDEKTSGWLYNRDTGANDINWQRIQTGRVKLRYTPTERLTLDVAYWKYKNHSPGGFDYAYRDMTVDTYYDVHSDWDSGNLRAQYDLGDSQLLYVYSNGGLGRNLSGVSLGQTYSSTIDIGVHTNELRWTSIGEHVVDWTAGVYQRDAERADTYHSQGYDPSHSSQQDKSYALYGELTWNFAEQWATSLGARYFREKVDAYDSTTTQINQLNHTFTHASPKATLTYHPTHDSSLYASVANGYRSGQLQLINSIVLADQMGLQIPASTRPDQIWSYELGYKTVLDGGRLSLDSALFYTRWKDVPIYFPLQGGALYALLNSGGTSTKGAELGMTWMPDKAWTFQFSGSYVHAVYDRTEPGTNFHKGTPVFNVPRLQLTGSAAYTWPVSSSIWGVARADISHFSRRETSSTAEGLSGDPITRVSARLGLEFASGWSAYLFGENLTNDKGAVDPPYEGQATRLRPRTIGIEATYSY
jgi:outer membrane receptor protein involved in Fe transport